MSLLLRWGAWDRYFLHPSSALGGWSQDLPARNKVRDFVPKNDDIEWQIGA